jgi:SAM-dependent methyltransferase
MKLIDKLKCFLWRCSIRGLAKGPHITRYVMYTRLAELGKDLPRKTGRVLSVSHSSNLAGLMGIQPSEIVEASYPDENILGLTFPDESFDFVLSDQVFEHIEGNPQTAVDECYRVLKPGGIAVHTTCFINPIHLVPGDYWRFTPDALRLLHRGWTRSIVAEGWGNFEAWSLIRSGMRRVGIPHASWHPLHKIATRNDPEWPIVTWIIAQK